MFVDSTSVILSLDLWVKDYLYTEYILITSRPHTNVPRKSKYLNILRRLVEMLTFYCIMTSKWKQHLALITFCTTSAYPHISSKYRKVCRLLHRISTRCVFSVGTCLTSTCNSNTYNRYFIPFVSTCFSNPLHFTKRKGRKKAKTCYITARANNFCLNLLELRNEMMICVRGENCKQSLLYLCFLIGVRRIISSKTDLEFEWACNELTNLHVNE